MANVMLKGHARVDCTALLSPAGALLGDNSVSVQELTYIVLKVLVYCLFVACMVGCSHCIPV